MQVNLDLAVSKEEFFDFIYESLLSDIKLSNNKSVNKSDIKKGYRYKKNLKSKLGREGEVTVIIKELRLYDKYTAVFESHQGKNVISYDVESIDDRLINVSYSEDYIEADKIKKWNFNLINFFYEKRANKKGEKMLRNIEQYIIQNRKGDQDD